MNHEAPYTVEEIAEQVSTLAKQLHAAGRKDLLLKAIGAPLLEELRIEAAKAKLSRLIITEDYRFIRKRWNCNLCIRRCICCSWRILRVLSLNDWLIIVMN